MQMNYSHRISMLQCPFNGDIASLSLRRLPFSGYPYFTLRKYLQARHEPPRTAHATITEIHLCHLNSQQVKPVPLSIPNAHPFSISNASSRPPTRRVSQIFFSVLGGPCKRGTFLLREIAYTKDYSNYNTYPLKSS